ncbi:hypothetical protein EAH50_11150 [Escherichia coli]|nr:hypothetical protein EAH50_11150 [Escherichia coli]
MTVQTSKNPQVDIAEDNAFFPSEYSLSQYTSPVSDLDGVDYPKPYRGKGRCEQVPDMRSCLSSGAIEQGSS